MTRMKKQYYCNALAEPLREASEPKSLPFRFFTRLRVYKDTAVARVKYRFLKKTAKEEIEPISADSIDLQPGELVEVRSMREIAQTLDDRGRHKGLYFMPEMEKFCGQRFKIFKKVEIILLESTGELRKLRSPTLFLDGVFCDGSQQGGCARSCFHFWRDVWLKRVTE